MASGIRIMSEEENFYYKGQDLFFGKYSLSELGSASCAPTYVHNADILMDQFYDYTNNISDLDYFIACSVKGCHISVLNLLGKMGVRIICNNEGQIAKAIQSALIEPANVIFAGAYKTQANITYAIKSGVGLIIIECIEDLQLVNRVAASLNTKVPVLIRTQFNIDKSSSVRNLNARNTNNFGIGWEELQQLCNHSESYPGVVIKGMSIKIVSRSAVQSKPLQIVVKRLLTVIEVLKSKGHTMGIIDFTGNEYNGVYSDYATLRDFNEDICKYLGKHSCKFIFGFNYKIIDYSGCVLSRVIMIQDLPQRRYMVLDSSFSSDLYRSSFSVLPVKPVSGHKKLRMNIICDVDGEQETVLKKIMLTQGMSCGHLVAISNVGYSCMLVGSVMNSSVVPDVIMVKEGKIIYSNNPEHTLESAIFDSQQEDAQQSARVETVE